MFGMLDSSKSINNTKGIGLGLSISNLIVKKFNGSLDYTSELGVGSNFFFTFELLQDDQNQIEQIDYHLESEDEQNFKSKTFNMSVKIIPSEVSAAANNIFEKLKLFK